jgi:hypothetical protein
VLRSGDRRAIGTNRGCSILDHLRFNSCSADGRPNYLQWVNVIVAANDQHFAADVAYLMLQGICPSIAG